MRILDSLAGLRLRRLPPGASGIALAFAALLVPTPGRAQEGAAPEQGNTALEQALATLELREIGPAIMGGRVTDIAAHASDPQTFYVGFASGGLWKTTNHAVRWTPLFDDQPTASIGAVALAPSNPKLVWVGTGEADNRQSSTWGVGVFRSLDGGETWQHMGLENTRQIARIVVHPTNPAIVYVAAVGHLWGPNPERGVYKTVDGGQTWQKVLFVDENTGAIDIAMDPHAPNVLFAAMYQRRRTAWGFSADGEGGGLYRSLDGGATWVELTAGDGASATPGSASVEAGAPGEPSPGQAAAGETPAAAAAAAGAGESEGAEDDEGESVTFNARGLPTGHVGRIGIDVHDPNGDLVYAVIESHDDGTGVYRTMDRGETWEKLSDHNPRPMYFSLVRIDPGNPERIWLGGVELSVSDDAGRTWRDGAPEDGVHSDHHALWVDPTDSDHVVVGNDGGVASTWDGGENWQHHHNIAVAQYYQIGLDMADPYTICGGLQDNNSWCGPSRTLDESGLRNRHWNRVWGGDGFWNVIDPTNPEFVYSESQNGRMGRYNRVTGESASLQPVARPTPEDTASEYRFHWNTPIVVSQHDPATVYVGANHLLRTRDRAFTWEEASPDLTRQIDRDTLPIMGMPVDSTTLSLNDGVGTYGTIVEIGESPLDAAVLYAGTDDGKLWVTRDGGANWTDLTANVPELGQGDFVSAIEPSLHEAGRVYLAYDGHKSDDYNAYVFVSENYGEDWTQITSGLPVSSVNVIREHADTPGLLFLGNEVGLFVSVDNGSGWTRLTGNFPTVPVDDIRIHPRENDLVIATHGRSIWILHDITPLEQVARAQVLASDAHLFPVQQATMWSLSRGAWFPADNTFIAENPPAGARIRYWLAEDRPPADTTVVAALAEPDPIGGRALDGGALDGYGGPHATADRPARPTAPRSYTAPKPASVSLQILNRAGEVIRQLEGPGGAGIQQAVWDLRIAPPYEPEPEPDAEEEDDDDEGPDGPRVLPGTYTVRLTLAGDTMATDVVVRQDPRIEVQRTVLEQRQDALMRLYALAAPVYEAEHALEEAEQRIGAARELLEQSAEGAAPLLARADTLVERIEAAREALDEANTGGRLQSAIEGIAARPTEDQLWQIDQAWEEVPEAIRGVNELLTGEFAAFEGSVYQPTARPAPLGPVELPTPPAT